MPGWLRSNSESSSATTSPSRPMAQKRRTVSREDEELQPAASDSAATRPRIAARDRPVRELLTGAGEPTTREAGLLEASTQVRVLAHHAPDERATVVLDHREHGPLVDAEIVTSDPTKVGHATAVPEGDVEDEGSIERVEKAVLRVNVLAEAAMHLEGGRDDQLRRERHGGDDRRRRQCAVVVLARAIDAACRVGAKPSAPADVLDLDVSRSIAGGDPPDGCTVVPATTRVGDCVRLLSVDRAPAVLEVVEAAALHVRIADVAEIGPHVRVLMTEQRRKAQELLTEERAPVLVVGTRPFHPGVETHGKGGRAERQEVHEHGLVVASPVVFQETFFGRPAEADGGRLGLGPSPVYTPIDVVHERANFHFLGVRAVEVGLTEQRAGEQDSGIDSRQLTVLEAFARLHVQEVIEESPVTGPTPSLGTLRSPGKEPERREHALLCLLARDVATLDADGIRGEGEAHRGDAGVRRRGIPVRDQPVLGIGGVPKEAEGTLLELREKRVDDRTRDRKS